MIDVTRPYESAFTTGIVILLVPESKPPVPEPVGFTAARSTTTLPTEALSVVLPAVPAILVTPVFVIVRELFASS